jgi:hypothetical protein
MHGHLGKRKAKEASSFMGLSFIQIQVTVIFHLKMITHNY